MGSTRRSRNTLINRFGGNPPWVFLGLFAVLLWTSCSAPSQGLARDDSERLDVLTNFALALSERDYAAASAMMAPEDRALLVDAEGRIHPRFLDRLGALRRSTLMNNPFIRVEHGKVRGVHDVLPIIAQASSPEPYSELLAGPVQAPEILSPETVRPEDVEKEELRKAAEAFFRSVHAEKWNKALGFVSEEEKGVFVGSDGRLKEGAKRRLSAVDTNYWEALDLEDGKLNGVVLIIPANPPD